MLYRLLTVRNLEPSYLSGDKIRNSRLKGGFSNKSLILDRKMTFKWAKNIKTLTSKLEFSKPIQFLYYDLNI